MARSRASLKHQHGRTCRHYQQPGEEAFGCAAFPHWVAVLTSSPHQPTKQAYFQSHVSKEEIVAQRG